MKQISLSPAEWQVMEQLWDQSPQTLTALVKALGAETGWSKSTVITLVGRLEQKGAVRYTVEGRARQYVPAVDRRAAAMEETTSLLRRVYRGSVGMMLHTLADSRALTADDIRELEAILEQAKKEG